MAHSSGGGSSSGGSHSGSSHGSSRSSNPRFGSNYYPGSHRYVYYENNRPVYYFSDRVYTARDAKAQKINNIISGLITIVVTLVFLWSNIHIFHKVNIDYESNIIVDDKALKLNDEQISYVVKQFTEFKTETGVTPALVTVTNDDWAYNYNTLETYALAQYYKMFNDEKHWLIVLDYGYEEDQFIWEGIIGDDCGSAITAKYEQLLTDTIQKNLWRVQQDKYAEAVADSFIQILPEVTAAGFQIADIGTTTFIGIALFLSVFLISGLSDIVKGIRMDVTSSPKLNSVQCSVDKEKPKEDNCKYCGGLYVHGLHMSCPHCGAVIPADNDETINNNQLSASNMISGM